MDDVIKTIENICPGVPLSSDGPLIKGSTYLVSLSLRINIDHYALSLRNGVGAAWLLHSPLASQLFTREQDCQLPG